MAEKNGHIGYIDTLRILASFMVMLLHTAAHNWCHGNAYSFAWQMQNFYDAVSRPAVPLFLMISGALLLGREIEIKTIYTKYIPRIALAFVFWTIIYAIYRPNPEYNLAQQLIKGPVHFWYCYLIIGLYTCLPLLSKIAHDERLLNYFLVLLFIPCFCINTAAKCLAIFSGTPSAIAEGVFYALEYFFKNTAFWAIFYFLFGYFLNKTEISRRLRLYIYVAGIAGTALTVWLTWYATLLKGSPTATFYYNDCLNVAFESVAIFVFAKYNFKSSALVEKISRYSFGAYLVHLLFISKLLTSFESLRIVPQFAIPCFAVIVFLLSYCTATLLGKIPVVRKFVI